MAAETHSRAMSWVANRLGAEEVGRDAAYHLRSADGRRIRVAGRHIEGRQPNYFHLGPTLEDDPFDDLAVVLFDPDWSVRYAYRLPLEIVRLYYKQPGRQDCRLMIRGVPNGESWRGDDRVEALVTARS